MGRFLKMRKNFSVFLLSIFIFGITSQAHAFKVLKGDDNNDWLHYVGAVSCQVVGQKMGQIKKAKYPRLQAFTICSLIGIFKEYVVDDHPTRRNIYQNTGSLFLGMSFSF